jgi:hypothetical protein
VADHHQFGEIVARRIIGVVLPGPTRHSEVPVVDLIQPSEVVQLRWPLGGAHPHDQAAGDVNLEGPTILDQILHPPDRFIRRGPGRLVCALLLYFFQSRDRVDELPSNWFGERRAIRRDSFVRPLVDPEIVSPRLRQELGVGSRQKIVGIGDVEGCLIGTVATQLPTFDGVP